MVMDDDLSRAILRSLQAHGFIEPDPPEEPVKKQRKGPSRDATMVIVGFTFSVLAFLLVWALFYAPF